MVMQEMTLFLAYKISHIPRQSSRFNLLIQLDEELQKNANLKDENEINDKGSNFEVVDKQSSLKISQIAKAGKE